MRQFYCNKTARVYKGKVFPMQAIKAQRGNRGIVPLMKLDGQPHAPNALPQRNDTPISNC